MWDTQSCLNFNISDYRSLISIDDVSSHPCAVLGQICCSPLPQHLIFFRYYYVAILTLCIASCQSIIILPVNLYTIGEKICEQHNI